MARAGSAAGGLVAALTGVTVYIMSSSNFLGLLGYAGGGGVNLAFGVISSVVALVVAAVVTYLFGFSKEDFEADAAAASAALEG